MKKVITYKKGISAYYQIKEDIISRISSGEWKVGEKIPSEMELVSLYGVSRMTLRKALDELAEEEILFKERGVGTFAARKQVVRNQEYLLGFHEEMAKQGRSFESRIRLRETIRAPHISRLLDLDRSAEVYHYQRLRYLEGSELLLDDSYLPIDVAEAADLDACDDNDSLFRRLEASGVTLLYAHKEVQAILADEYLAETLGYRRGGPLFHVRTVVYNHRGRPLLVAELHIRSDRYTIKISAKRHR